MSAANRPTVLVTGATRGIGRAVADLLAPDHDLIVGGRSAAEVSAVCGRLPSARPFVADLADEDAVGGAVEELGGLDRLDGLVHSAGVLGSGALTDLRRAGWRQTLETNVVAVADLTRLLLQPLVAAQGTVVVVNSGSGLRAHGPGGAYSASKFAARAVADSMREELRPRGVRVSTVYPGRTATDMQRELRSFERGEYDEARYLRPETVASAVRFVLSAPQEACVEDLSIRPR